MTTPRSVLRNSPERALGCPAREDDTDLNVEVASTVAIPHPRRWRRAARVLVLDDDLATHAFVRHALHDVEIIPHTSALGALQSLTRSFVDAIVMDLMLTGSNGLDLLRLLPEPRRPTRIVVLTEWQAGADQSRLLGATATLSKPCTVEALRIAVLGRDPIGQNHVVPRRAHPAGVDIARATRRASARWNMQAPRRGAS